MDDEIEPNESVSTAVRRAVSAVEDRRPCSLPPLADVLDPNALDAIFAPGDGGKSRTGGQLTFVYSNCRVTIENGEYLTVLPLGSHRLQSSGHEPSDRSD